MSKHRLYEIYGCIHWVHSELNFVPHNDQLLFNPKKPEFAIVIEPS